MTKYLTIRAYVRVGDEKIGVELVDTPIPDDMQTEDLATYIAVETLGKLVGKTSEAIQALLDAPPCPYDFSHTRHWCGNPLCRPS